MRIAAGVNLTALAAITIAACGGSSGSAASSSAPHLSAASACSAFASWQKQTQGNPTDWGKRVILLRATSQAPSGQLYADLFTLESDAIDVSRDRPHRPGIREPDPVRHLHSRAGLPVRQSELVTGLIPSFLPAPARMSSVRGTLRSELCALAALAGRHQKQQARWVPACRKFLRPF